MASDDPCPKCAVLEERLSALDRFVVQRFKDIETIIDKMFVETQRRFEEHNRFREQVVSDRVHSVSREAYDERQIAINLALKSIEDFTANLKGRIWSIGFGLTVLSIAVGIALKFF